MVFIRGNIDVTGGHVANVKFSTPINVDMGGERVKNIGEAEENDDAISKRSMENFVSYRITILDTIIQHDDTWILIDVRLFGSFFVTVFCTEEGRPSMVAHLSKNDRKRNAMIQNISSMKGSRKTYLELKWLPYEGVYVKKNGLYDEGLYQIKTF